VKPVRLISALIALPPAWAGGGGDPLPTLDEMLGLGGERDRAAEERLDRALDRMLTAREAAEQFAEAVRLMEDSAAMLTRPGGTGLETQRVQEDILRKLDAIIASAEQNQGQGSGSGSPAPSSDPSGANRPASQSGGAEASGGRGDNTSEAMPPAARGAELRAQSLMDAAAWGALPERLRGALRQGLSEEFSAAYRRMTEAYYRRLAEQAEGEP
jgi:hypothetical protein